MYYSLLVFARLVFGRIAQPTQRQRSTSGSSWRKKGTDEAPVIEPSKKLFDASCARERLRYGT